MDILELIDQMEDILEEASSVPFTNKVWVDVDSLYNIISEIRIQLPDEIKQATWIKEERQKILSEAKEESEHLLGQTEEKMVELVDQSEVAKKANEKAKTIIRKAENSAKVIMEGSLDYADNVLFETQENLKELIDKLNINREELRDNNDSKDKKEKKSKSEKTE